jgi:NADP-dependent alcohol dehydrogenase
MSIQNFDFYNPVKVLFGKGQITKLASLVPVGAKVLLTYGGGSIKNNGVYQQVINALSGFNVIEFGGIEPNPKVETLRKAVDLGKREKVNFILAVGGGSVVDGSKLIAISLLIENDPWDVLTRKAPIENAVPIGVVMTLPATGTEMNGNSVISNQTLAEKLAFSSRLVMPVFSILDPETCMSLPDTQIANGVVDAFVHVMEQYLTYPVHANIQDRFAESILSTLIDVGPKVLADKSNYQHMANFMWSATMALNGLIGSGVPNDWATHDIGHELTALHNIDHARTLAIVLPGVMKIMANEKKDKILQYGARVWGITDGTEQDKIDTIILKTIVFFEQMGIKTRLSDYQVGESSINEIVNRFTKRGVFLGENQSISPQKIQLILENRL